MPRDSGARADKADDYSIHVIASGAKQSTSRHDERMDCFASLAMAASGVGSWNAASLGLSDAALEAHTQSKWCNSFGFTPCNSMVSLPTCSNVPP